MLSKLLTWAKSYTMTKREREAQRRSFAYGNVNLSNHNVTKEMVERVANEIDDEKDD